MRLIFRLSVGLLLLAVLVGCRSKQSRGGAVSGQVTYKGRRVNDAALLLYPTSGEVTIPITIPVDHDGRFRITDVPPGEYLIVVQGAEGQSSDMLLLRDIPPEKKAEMKAKLEQQSTATTIPFPNKYKDLKTTDLKCKITDKDQPMDLELKD
jgi:hypothetical protein